MSLPLGPTPRPVVVSAVQPDPRRAGSLRVLVGGAVRWTIGPLPGDLPLRAGQVVDAGVAERLDRLADAEAALRTGLRMLGIRAFARADLARRLARKPHPAASVDAALAELDRMGLLDDLAFARAYVETRARRGRGPARLMRELAAMGVERRTIERAVEAGWPADLDPLEAARPLALRRARSLAGLPMPQRRRRLAAFLARRGFTGPGALRLITEVLTPP